MAEPRLPCAEGNQDDWFISRDGKQYGDESLLTEAAALGILKMAEEAELEGEERQDFIERATGRAEVDAKRASLQRRRHAREACHTDCLIRTQCLDKALTGGHTHGTWGGYYEEELRELRIEIHRRRRTDHLL